MHEHIMKTNVKGNIVNLQKKVIKTGLEIQEIK